MLCKCPGFTIVAILSLALGIGANTAIFSLLNAILLRSLPVPSPDELRVVKWSGFNPSLPSFGGFGTEEPNGKHTADAFPYPTYVAFRDRLAGTVEVFTCDSTNVTAVAPDGAATGNASMVSGNFFSGYGVNTALGRPIGDDDDRSDAKPVVVISDRWWEHHFDRNDDVLGQTITLNRHVFTVVGVLPPEFVGPDGEYATDFYVPLYAQAQLRDYSLLESPDTWRMPIMARLPRGVDEAQTAATLTGVFNQILTAPGSKSRIDQPSVLLEDGRQGLCRELRQRSAQPLWLLQAVVALVLLIACANLAGLLLARGATRRHEMAVRAALGASRGRLAGQSLVEAAILAGAGGVLGLLLALSGLTSLFARLARLGDSDPRVDGIVLLFALAVTAGTVLLFGLLPALRSGRADPANGLKNSKQMAAPRLHFGRTLIVVQVALSVLLVVTAGLLIRTSVNLARVDPGFDVENLLVFRVDGKQTDHGDQQLTAFFDRLREAVAAIPEVQAVTTSHNTLLSGGLQTSRISIPGYSEGPGERLRACELFVGESFFRTVGIPIVLGREFDATDSKDARPVVIVNELFAQAYFPEGNPVGSVFSIGSVEHQIVGVCRDARYQAVRNDVEPTMYSALRQIDADAMWFGVRTAVPPLSLVPTVRRALATIDRNIAMSGINTQESLFARSISQERHFAYLCGGLAALALFLSCIGLYGLMAYNLSRRICEIGIRMALGARPTDVARPVIHEALLLVMAGMAIGMPAALAATRVIRSSLFAVEPHDPLTLVCAVVFLLAVPPLAAWIPARRAAKVDPMEALRYE
jgi:predicted permease